MQLGCKENLGCRSQCPPEYVEAKNAYVGPLSKKTIEYCQEFYPDSHVILSAKYDFLLPHEKITNYNSACNRNPMIIPPELKKQTRTKTLNGIPLIEYEKVVVIKTKLVPEFMKKFS
ncbi:hypothetical protein A3K92_01960 [Thermococcus gorgonarius]|uniref:Uncharacterized protein n=1 Tax=Thermococcus gorgonarius TaxID=71997 RepID=A0A2Z2M3P8_THEGO|nr:hypothetical protein A3K92_01960 [Thermococcus gorgonarius]